MSSGTEKFAPSGRTGSGEAFPGPTVRIDHDALMSGGLPCPDDASGVVDEAGWCSVHGEECEDAY